MQIQGAVALVTGANRGIENAEFPTTLDDKPTYDQTLEAGSFVRVTGA